MTYLERKKFVKRSISFAGNALVERLIWGDGDGIGEALYNYAYGQNIIEDAWHAANIRCVRD